LETDGYFPAFGLGKDENVFLSFLVAERGAEDEVALEFDGLWWSC
jgi:hypothetical protein